MPGKSNKRQQQQQQRQQQIQHLQPPQQQQLQQLQQLQQQTEPGVSDVDPAPFPAPQTRYLYLYYIPPPGSYCNTSRGPVWTTCGQCGVAGGRAAPSSSSSRSLGRAALIAISVGLVFFVLGFLAIFLTMRWMLGRAESLFLKATSATRQ